MELTTKNIINYVESHKARFIKLYKLSVIAGAYEIAKELGLPVNDSQIKAEQKALLKQIATDFYGKEIADSLKDWDEFNKALLAFIPEHVKNGVVINDPVCNALQQSISNLINTL